MNVYTSVVWIPGHADIYYNELTDSIAKSTLKPVLSKVDDFVTF